MDQSESFKKELQTVIIEEKKHSHMIFYSFLQYLGSWFEDLEFFKKLVGAGDSGLEKSAITTNDQKTLSFLENQGFVVAKANSVIFDYNQYVEQLHKVLQLDGETANKLNLNGMKSEFVRILEQIPFSDNLAAYRSDGIGLNKDKIFNRLRGFLRKNEFGKMNKVLLNWLR